MYKPSPLRFLPIIIVLFLIPVLSPAGAADQDNNVEWSGISHVWWQDRRPLCPVDNQAFDVRLQSYINDLTGVRVRLYDGGSISWITASVIGWRGPYSVWEASIPATSSATDVSYYIEVTDGSDIDYLSVSGMSDGLPAGGGWTLDFENLEHAPLGATPVTGGVVFRVWAPGATDCYVRGDFNVWALDHPMSRLGEDFIAEVPGASAGQEYKYYFDPGGIWKPDARARAFNSGNNNNSIIVDPFSYDWLMHDFQNPGLDEMIVYQLHVGTFAGRNDPYGSAAHPSGYLDVAERAGHLAEPGHAALRVYDVSGRLIRTLVDRHLSKGKHSALWDGRNSKGGVAASGVYFYRLTASGWSRTRRMVPLR